VNRFHEKHATRSGPKSVETMRRPSGGQYQWISPLILLLATVHATSTKQPHIIFILADDLASCLLRFAIYPIPRRFRNNKFLIKTK